MLTINATEHLVSDQNGQYSYHVLVKNFPLFVKRGLDEYTPLDDFLTDYTAQTVFNPDTTADWCENLEYLENLGLFVQAKDGTHWRIESIDGSIYAINPLAEWDDSNDCYVLKEGEPC